MVAIQRLIRSGRLVFSLAALVSSLGTGRYQSHSVVFLSKNVEVMLASSDSGEKLEALAHELLATL